MKTALLGLLESKKVWTTLIGLFCTFFGAWLAKHGFDMSDAHVEKVAEGITVFFGLLLSGQALQDHGKEKAKIEAASAAWSPVEPTTAEKKAEGGFVRLGLLLMIVAVGLVVACGASSRHDTLRATYAAATTAEAGFQAWDVEHKHQIAVTAPDDATGTAQLDAYMAKRQKVLDGLTALWKALAAAAALDDDPSLKNAVVQLKTLGIDLSTLTGGALQ